MGTDHGMVRILSPKSSLAEHQMFVIVALPQRILKNLTTSPQGKIVMVNLTVRRQRSVKVLPKRNVDQRRRQPRRTLGNNILQDERTNLPKKVNPIPWIHQSMILQIPKKLVSQVIMTVLIMKLQTVRTKNIPILTNVKLIKNQRVENQMIRMTILMLRIL